MKRRWCALCLTAILCAEPSFTQELDWNLTGAGARAEGFGGAFIGIADDATAIVWNPAGLTQLERTEVSSVGRYIMASSEFKSELTTNKYLVSNNQSHFNFNFGSIAIPFQVGGTNVVIAAAYQSQLDFYGKESSDTSSYESTGGGATVTPGLAIRLGPVFSLGAATNIWIGPAEQNLQYNARTKDANWRLYSQKLESSFTGLNFVAGALIDLGGLPNPIPLKLGATVRTPFTLKREDKFTLSQPGFTFADPNPKSTLEIDMPLMVGIGSSLRIGDNFTLAADFEMRLFKDTKVKEKDSKGSVVSSDSLTARNENLNQFRVGAEYLVVFSGGVIPLRAGFRTVPTVRANYEWNRADQRYYSTSQVGGIGFSGGTGIIFSSFALDFAYSREQWNEQKWTDAGVTDFSYKYSTDRFSLSLIVYL